MTPANKFLLPAMTLMMIPVHDSSKQVLTASDDADGNDYTRT